MHDDKKHDALLLRVILSKVEDVYDYAYDYRGAASSIEGICCAEFAFGALEAARGILRSGIEKIERGGLEAA